MFKSGPLAENILESSTDVNNCDNDHWSWVMGGIVTAKPKLNLKQA